MAEPTIYQAMAAVMNELAAVGKEGYNKHQGYKFRGIDGVMNAVGPALRKHNVVVVPELLDLTETETTTTRGNRTNTVLVKVRYTFHGPAGDSIVTVVPGSAMDTGDKAVPKAMSVAFRTCLIQSLTLPTNEPDPDSETFERISPEEAEARSQASRSRLPSKEEQEARAKAVVEAQAHHDAVEAAKRAAEGLGDSAVTVVPSIVEEVTGRAVKLAGLNVGELREVTAEIERAVANMQEKES